MSRVLAIFPNVLHPVRAEFLHTVELGKQRSWKEKGLTPHSTSVSPTDMNTVPSLASAISSPQPSGPPLVRYRLFALATVPIIASLRL